MRGQLLRLFFIAAARAAVLAPLDFDRDLEFPRVRRAVLCDHGVVRQHVPPLNAQFLQLRLVIGGAASLLDGVHERGPEPPDDAFRRRMLAV